MFPKENRPYIRRLQTDPRMRAVFDGWIAQAMVEADRRFPDPREYRAYTQYAVQQALALAVSFVLDNDREYAMVCEERDRLLETALKISTLFPSRPFVVPKEIDDIIADAEHAADEDR